MSTVDMNNTLREFLATIDARFSDDSSTTSMSDWIIKNTRLRKRPFSFKGFEFQRQIVDDFHPDLSCMKPSQVGLTESQLRKYLGFLRRNTATTGIYSLPSDKMRDRVSQTRARVIIEGDKVFNPPTAEKPVRQKSVYQIDQSFAYFTGSTESDATSIPADILIHDELDLTDQQMIGLFQSRLQASKFKIRQQFSTPTFIGYGIDSAYTSSDQFEYMMKCSSCGHHQLPTFEPQFIHPILPHDDLTKLTLEDIDALPYEDAVWCCERCSRPLDLGNPMLREWVARYPGRKSRGYRVRPTSTNSISIPYVFQQLRNYIRLDNLKGFHNTVLGEAYNDSNARLAEADIRAALTSPAPPDIPSYSPCFIGIDAGLICHVVMGMAEPNHAFLFLQVPRDRLLDTIANLRSKHNIISGCMDRFPYTDLADKIRDLTGTIMPVGYATAGTAPPLAPGKDEFDNVTHWTANRTRALDTVASDIRNHTIKLSGYGALDTIIIKHLRDMVRIENADTPPIWNKITGDDHFFHALSYMRLAQRLIQASNYRSDQEERSHLFLVGGDTVSPLGLSPRSLNRASSRDW